MKKALLFLSPLLLITFFIIANLSSNNDNSKTPANSKSLNLENEINLLIEKVSTCETLDIAEITQCVLKVLKDETNSATAPVTADRFIKASAKSQFVARNCHAVSHLFGRWAWESFADKSYEEGLEGCSFGYYHGLMEQLAKDSFPEMLKLSKTVCEKAINMLDLGGCIHGVGHAVGMTGLETSEYPKMCEQVSELPEMVQECFRGSIMIWSELNPGTKAEDISMLCSNMPDTYVGKCVDGLVYDIQDIGELAKIDNYCDAELSRWSRDCWFSSGGAVAARIVFSGAANSLLGDVCSNNAICLESAGYHLVAGGSQNVKWSNSVCSILSKNSAKICSDGVSRAELQFKDDPGFLKG